ncbi:nucleoporin NUP35 isoform X2 [Alosa pseudoharengus]|uniref:nucleoporin NUP35 isoform X3 n=1 Tax=Alosa sapidissima TaxID=34773 RepID=UPI001C087D9A|nr:nucleoporin NUP35 isoform X3 [Alosa sapidissima]XP_048095752.1 nucleoporin NUP35 isoform X3 [Alosa alosa]
MEFQVGTEPMTLGSPTSPKPGTGAQFLPGFLMGDLPAPVTPQPRTFGVSGVGTETRSPLMAGGSPPQPVVPTPKDKSGAPPVRSIYDDLASPGVGMSPLSARRQPFSVLQSPLPSFPGTPGTGDALSSEDQLDDTWVTVFGFPPASASYILLQFAQYGNVLKHVMSNTGNWMHIQYQSKLQARKALSKDGRIFGEAIMIGVKPCIDKNVMEGSAERGSSSASVFSTPAKANGTPSHPVSTPRSAMRPLSAAYKASSSDYQVVADRQTPRKDDTFVSKAMEYMFGW